MANPSANRSPSHRTSTHTLHGLSLPAATLQALQRRGIYCTPGVTVEHQHHAKRYVLRGVESGGAVADMGRFCAYLSPDGLPLPWLQSIDSLAVNGRHAIVLAESLIRVEMLRMVRTCELSISLHALFVQAGRTRPEVTSKWLFRGHDGVIPLELWRDEHRTLRGQLSPIFYTRAGEALQVPRRFEEAIQKITAAVCCIGCKHTHVAVAPNVAAHEVAL
jgi:hypothetical protein